MKCGLCSSIGANRSSCPDNPHSLSPSYKKHPLAKKILEEITITIKGDQSQRAKERETVPLNVPLTFKLHKHDGQGLIFKSTTTVPLGSAYSSRTLVHMYLRFSMWKGWSISIWHNSFMYSLKDDRLIQVQLRDQAAEDDRYVPLGNHEAWANQSGSTIVEILPK